VSAAEQPRYRSGAMVLRRLKDALHDRGPQLARPRTRLATAGAVALTFDDGPDPDHTPRLLDELRDCGAVATFFCLGDAAERHPDLVARMAAEGHAVGSHSYSHPEPWSAKYGGLVADYRRGRQAVADAAGRPVRLFRPPKGHIGLWEALAARRLGLQTWLWTIDSGDWRPGSTAASIVAELEHVDAGDVVLLHDAMARPLVPSVADRSTTVAAIRPLADLAARRGLRFITLADPAEASSP